MAVPYRSMPEIPGAARYRHGSGNQFRRPGPTFAAPPWPDLELTGGVDPRLAGVPDHPSNPLPAYVPMGTLNPANVYGMRPA